MKLVRILRIIRVMRTFKELRFIVNSLLGCFRAMCWSLLLVIVVMYMFGLVFVQLSTSVLQKGGIAIVTRNDLAVYWGSVLTSMNTLYISSTGGISWCEVARPLQELGSHLYLLFVVYVS